MNSSGTIYGKYVLLEKLASGGMAEIYKAKYCGVGGFEKYLVIKRILPHLSEDREFIEMFCDEAKISVTLQHSNIAQVWEMGRIKEDYFIALEYIAGKNLREIVKKCQGKGIFLSLEQSVYIMAEMCKGLEYAHQKKLQPGIGYPIIHRDISPQNVMVSYEGEVKIVDFGIAKARGIADNKTQAGVLKGKFGYMSPEQASGREIDHRSDIFSTGIVLWELLTSRRLFLGETDFNTLERVKSMEIPAPSLYNPMVPRELNFISLKALDRDLTRRYQTSGDMQADLSRFLSLHFADFTSIKLSSFMKTIFDGEIRILQSKAQSQRNIAPDMDNYPTQKAAGPSYGDGQIVKTTFAPGIDDDLDIDKLLKDEVSAVSLVTGSSADYPSKAQPYPILQKSPGKLPDFLRKQGNKNLAIVGIIAFGLGLLLFSLNTLLERGDKKDRINSMKVPPVAQKVGYVTISTVPMGARIYIDPTAEKSESIGHSPQPCIPLSPNSHVLKIEKDGYQTIEEVIDVKVTDIDHPLDLQYKLVKIVLHGSLTVESAPEDATIYLNSTNTGFKTPHTFEELEANSKVVVRLEKDGYRTVEEEVEIKANSNEKVEMRLYQRVGRFQIRSTPEGATIYLDGEQRGKTPLDIPDIFPGREYILKLAKKGYEEHSGSISLKNSDVPRTFNWTMKKLPPEYGYLIVQAKPWATVWINNKAVDETPTKRIKLKTGTYTLKLTHPQFPPKTMEITIQKDQDLPQIVDMTEK